MKIKYRIWNKGIPPKPIKLEIPGWGGENTDHSTGGKAQPWHCIPWLEGSTYGLELIYPFETETHVKNINGKIIFDANFSQEECFWSNPPSPPFSHFAEGHYGFTSSLDIQAPEDYVVRLEPHPRFFVDHTNTVPIAVPGHIQPWWPRIFFVVFKTPGVGQTHIFRKNEAYAQILIVPKKPQYEIVPMSYEEQIHRGIQAEKITKLSKTISKARWTDENGNNFDDKYKQLMRNYNTGGYKQIERFLEEADLKHNEKIESIKKRKKPKLIGKSLINNEVLRRKKENKTKNNFNIK